MFCNVHLSAEVEVYCSVCEAAVCPSCAVAHHAGHAGLRDLAGEVEWAKKALLQAAASVRIFHFFALFLI